MRPMSTEDFLREIVFGNKGNTSSSGTLLSGASRPMPPQAAGWQGSAPRQSLLGSPQAGSAPSGPGSGLFRLRCTTNQHGKVEAKEEQTPMDTTRWEYVYDVAGHLATVRCNGTVTEEYKYNAQGQRIADRVPEALRHRGGQRRFTYNYEGQLVEVDSTRYLYTASGTLRGRQEGNKTTYFSYGDDTRLDNVTLPSGNEVRYEYGQSLLPERIHVSRRLVGEYRWQSPLQLQEYYDVMQDTRYTFQYKGQRVPTGVHISGTGAAFIKERFQHGNLDYYSPMFQAQGATDSLFLHIGADQVGSVRTLSTEDGRMVKEITYDSFGNVLRDSFPQLSFPLGFAGGLVDEHTGFVRFGYRDYDPQIGRFTAQDPARDLRGDADLYDYCVDDPVSCVDPQGLATRQWNESLHRIIGDYRRVALYGVGFLLEQKKQEKAELDKRDSTEEVIRLREELAQQLVSLQQMQEMATRYGYDISRPAASGREAVQWTYFAYLAAIKEQNGAAMSIGRISTFLDVYLERDLREGVLTESQAQELIDDLVIKFRIVRFLRTPEYNQLFSGDPTWVTEYLGGMGEDGRTLVTKTSFRILNTLYNLGPAPEPNLTVGWSPRLPEGFKKFAAQVSTDTSSLQYISDDMLRQKMGDDAAIACCVSGMAVGKQMQFFGARVNLLKVLLYAINGGRDEISGDQVGPMLAPIQGDILSYEEVLQRFDVMADWLAKTYVNALNIIHFMHDKYCYEAALMALHDRDVIRTMACGIAGLSHTADSLAAIKYAHVHVVRDDTGLVVDYTVDGDFPRYGNNNDDADSLAVMLVSLMMNKIRQYATYRNAIHTQSVLTITSNVVYGKQTGNSPDGRRTGVPFAPGANPSNGADTTGWMAAMMSVAKLPYDDAEDGLSLTISVLPTALGSKEESVLRTVGGLDAYFGSDGFHANLNVLDPETLKLAMERPEDYPQLTVRVSGYAVNFVKLTKEQQLDILNRTFHNAGR